MRPLPLVLLFSLCASPMAAAQAAATKAPPASVTVPTPPPFEGTIYWRFTDSPLITPQRAGEIGLPAGTDLANPKIVLEAEAAWRSQLSPDRLRFFEADQRAAEEDRRLEEEERRIDAELRMQDEIRERFRTNPKAAKTLLDAMTQRRPLEAALRKKYDDFRAGTPDSYPKIARLDAGHGMSRLTVDWDKYRSIFVAPGTAAIFEWHSNRPAFSPVAMDQGIPLVDKVQYKVTKTKETRTILGYACLRYNVDVRIVGSPKWEKFTVWTTEELNANVQPLHRMKFGFATVGNILRQTPGFPLLVEGPRRERVEAFSIEPRRHDRSVFEIASP